MKRNQYWIIAAIMTLCGITAQAQETTMAFPQAEWSKAGDILQREAYNPTTDIRKVSYPLASRKGGANEATYRLDGIVADETTQGIVISNQKKIIRR